MRIPDAGWIELEIVPENTQPWPHRRQNSLFPATRVSQVWRWQQVAALTILDRQFFALPD